ncbi:MAG: DUF559 domain-containing protein [Candidatus Nezhaarchaeota archaeon]|nr:DUF559 domain-containing protein [Candidatus Nezhaarchaeota archaeon]
MRARKVRVKTPPRAYTTGEVAVIKELQARGVRFFTQREFVVGEKRFIIDIFVPPNIVVEIDGPHHLSSIRSSRDEVKDETLKSLGLKVLRFQDFIAKSQPSKVVDEILRNLKEV